MPKDQWKELRDTLEHDILSGKLQPGDQLPTEPTLARQFQTGRHSVRRALADLAHDGRLSIEQGRGTFVEPRPLRTYAIGRRTRLRQNLSSQGVDVSSQMLAAETLQKFASIHASVHNHFPTERHLQNLDHFKLYRAAALAEWRGLLAV